MMPSFACSASSKGVELVVLLGSVEEEVEVEAQEKVEGNVAVELSVTRLPLTAARELVAVATTDIELIESGA